MATAMELPIPGRPSTTGTRALRFVATADWQLGMRRRFLDAGAQARFAQDRLESIARIGELAAEVAAAFVLVGGDVFDDNQVDRQTMLRALDVLADFPAIPVLLLPGNHDPLDPASVYWTPEFVDRCPAHVRVVTDSEPIPVAEGVEVVGAPWRVKGHVENPARDVVADLPPRRHDGVVRILLAHGNIDALVGEQHQNGLLPLAELESAIDDGLLQFVVLGDRHSTTDVGATGRVWFPGAPEPTNYVERSPGHALVVEFTDDAVQVQTRRVGRWVFRQEVFDVAGAGDVDRVLRWLSDPGDKPRTIVKLGLRGVLSLRERERLDAALAESTEVFAAVQRWDRHDDLVTAPDDEDLEAMEASGFVADAVTELRTATTAGDEDAREAGDALALLYRLVHR